MISQFVSLPVSYNIKDNFADNPNIPLVGSCLKKNKFISECL